MRYLNAKGLSALPIGRLGENEATTVVFDISGWWRELYGDGAFSLVNLRPGDSDAYPCVIEQDAATVKWTVQSADLAKQGYGKCELIYTVGETIAKSEIYTTFIGEALTGDAEPPEPWEDWVQRVLEAGEAAEEAVKHYPNIDTDTHHWYTWDAERQVWCDTGVNAGGAATWNELQGKPFSTLGDTLQVSENGELNIVISSEYGHVSYDGVELTVS